MQAGVETLKPPTRCFSDWPAWLDQKLPMLAGKRVLMYCTGGVRCERASAYLCSKGELYSQVAQLRGVPAPAPAPVRLCSCGCGAQGGLR